MVRFTYPIEIDSNCSGQVVYLDGITFESFESFILRIDPYGRLPRREGEGSGQLNRLEVLERIKECLRVELHTERVVGFSYEGWQVLGRVAHFGKLTDRMQLRFRCPPAGPEGTKYHINIHVDAFLKEDE